MRLPHRHERTTEPGPRPRAGCQYAVRRRVTPDLRRDAQPAVQLLDHAPLPPPSPLRLLDAEHLDPRSVDALDLARPPIGQLEAAELVPPDPRGGQRVEDPDPLAVGVDPAAAE